MDQNKSRTDDIMACWVLPSLADGAEVDARHEGYTSLMVAAMEGMAEAVAALLERGADIHLGVLEPDASEDYEYDDGRVLLTGSTPLLLATHYGLAEEHADGGVAVVRLLLEHGGNPDQADAQGKTPLDWAAFHASSEAVLALLTYGADVQKASPNGETALITAAAVGADEVAQILLQAGANVNSANRINRTALMVAAYQGDVELVSLLLDSRADPSAESEGETALTLAEQNGHFQIAVLLRQAGALK